MNKHIAVLLSAVFVIAAVSCSNENSDPVAPGPSETFEKVDSRVLSANNTFGLNLFRTVYGIDRDKNMFISPLSVSMALGMTMNGTGGETRDAMQATLALEGLSEEEINTNYRLILDLLPTLDPGTEISVANSIWSREGFPIRPDFLETNQKYFDATAQELDFNKPDAADIINSWVYDNTGGKIDKMVASPIPRYVVMYLLNAVYFKAAWSVTFDEKLTRQASFTPFTGGESIVDMMHRKDSIPYYETQLYSAVDLYYGNGAYSMTAILPQGEGQSALDEVIDSLDPESWQSMVRSFTPQEVDLAMPKYTLDYEVKMNDVLKEMGMGIAFEPGRADFSRMSPEEGLFISEVKHKSFVEVNEQGTEAAASTSVEIGRTSVDPNLHMMQLNRPYIYVIRERETGTILFMGIFQKPA